MAKTTKKTAKQPITTKPTPKKQPHPIGLVTAICAIILIIAALLIFVIFRDKIFAQKDADGNTLTNYKIPTTEAEFKKAIEDKNALNCDITENGQTINFATTKDWNKLRMNGTDGTTEFDSIYTEGFTYMWNDDMAIKIPRSLTEIAEEATEEFDEDEDFTFTCTDPSKADFTLPNRDFTDFSNLNQ